jgi:hypothetical protein
MELAGKSQKPIIASIDSSEFLQSGAAKRNAGEVGPAVDAEFVIGRHEMCLDGVRGDEQRLGDVAVEVADSGQFGYPPFTRGECVGSKWRDVWGRAPLARSSAFARSMSGVAPQI